MNRNEFKRADCEENNRQREHIFQIGRAILENPELGYKETKRRRRWRHSSSN